MPPRKAAPTADANPMRLTWSPASTSREGELRFTAQPHADFKADMAEQPNGSYLLVVKSAVPSQASRPEHRQVYASLETAQATAARLFGDWAADYARDPGPASAPPPPAVPHLSQSDALAQLNRGNAPPAPEPAPEPEPAAVAPA